MSTRLHKQERLYTCAVAGLRTALDVQLGVNIPEAVLEAHGTDAQEPISKFGASTTHLRLMLAGANRTHNKSKPWRLKVKAQGDLKDLVRELVSGRIPLVRVFEPNEVSDFHMIVVMAITDERVKIFDPDSSASKKPRWMSAVDFVAWWSGDSSSTWYAVINAD